MDKDKKTRPGRNGGTLNVGGAKNGGRKHKLPALDEIGEKVLNEEGKDGLPYLESIIKSLAKEAERGNTAAAKILLDRFYGLPKQQIEMSGEVSTGSGLDLSKLSPDEKRQMLQLFEKTKSE